MTQPADLDLYLSIMGGSGAGMPSNMYGDLAPKFTSHGGGAAGGYGPAGGGFGTSTVRGIESQVRQGMSGLASEQMVAPRSAMAIPGPFMQVTPNTPAGLGAGDAGGLPALASQAAVPRVRTLPTGAEWPAGSAVKNNYPKLNGLMNKAQGTYYA